MFDLFGIADMSGSGHDILTETQLAQGGGFNPHVSGGALGTGQPTSTLVGRAGGFQIDLLWDASVLSNPHWQAIESDVIAAAKMFTSVFTNPMVLNIAVGFGEVDGFALGPNDLGESLTDGALGIDLPTLKALLGANDAGLVHAGLMAPDALTSLDGVAGANTFIPTAELKAFGLSSILPTGLIDGWIGLNNSGLLALEGNIKATQFDAVGVAAHELSEVMGRISFQGQSLGADPPLNNLYTALDLFRYSAPGVPVTTFSPGYFSLNDGVTPLNVFNDPNNGGDGGDWGTAAFNRTDAFDAFVNPGVKLTVSGSDYLALAALGYQIPGLS